MDCTITLKGTIDGAGIESGLILPTADLTYRGRTYLLLGDTNIADKPYICTKNADETYSWKPTTGFSW